MNKAAKNMVQMFNYIQDQYDRGVYSRKEYRRALTELLDRAQTYHGGSMSFGGVGPLIDKIKDILGID